MKKGCLIVILLIFFPASSILSQQLEFEIQLIDTSTYWQSTPDIVFLDPSTIFMTWTDYFTLEKKIFCAKSNDSGINFLPSVEPDPLSPTKILSSVDVDSSGNPYLVWSDYRTGHLNIRFSKSTNGGASFIQSIIVDSASVNEYSPKIKVSSNGEQVFVAWVTLYGGGTTADSAKLFFSRSTDAGGSFLPPQHIGGITERQQYAFSFDISESGDTVAFVWQNNTLPNERLFFSSSVDSGVTFSSRNLVDPTASKQFQPSLSLNEDSVYIAYTDDRNSNWDIFMATTQISNTPTFSYKIVDDEFPHNQEQPSIDLDNQGNIYISYRNEENYTTNISINKKGTSFFRKDWVGIYGFDNTDSKIAVKDTLNIFLTWEYHILDTMSITIFSRSVPAQPPGPPENLFANGANPSPWDTTPDFRITVVKPYDPSGIFAILYKLNSPPVHNFDTTGIFIDTSLTDTSYFMVTDSVIGVVPLYVWLMDGKGYVDFQNNSFVLLRYDTIPPQAPVLISPVNGFLTNNKRPTFNWHSVSDLHSGLHRYIVGVYSDSALHDSVFIEWTPDTFTTPTSDLPDGNLYWIVLARDFAGNLSRTSDTFLLRIDTSPLDISTVVSPDPGNQALLGRDYRVEVTSNRPLDGIPNCYIIGSNNNRLDIELDRDSLDMDSTLFSNIFVLVGLEPGPAKLYVEARDKFQMAGEDSVDFNVVSGEGLLPEKRVYTWPNPASDVVHFRFFVSRNAAITVEIFTITGRKIKELTGTAQGGDRKSEISWDTKDVGSDLYIFRVQARSIDGSDESSVIKRFAIVK